MTTYTYMQVNTHEFTQGQGTRESRFIVTHFYQGQVGDGKERQRWKERKRGDQDQDRKKLM